MSARIRRITWLLLATLAWIVAGRPADAAITEVAATTASSSVSVTTLSVPVPSGTLANDVLLVQIAATNAGETVSAPAGWTAVRSNNQTYLAIGITQALFYRVATAAEPASYAFGLSSSALVAGSMIAFRGVDTGAPILGSSGQGGAALIDTAPAIAACQAGTLQVAFFGYSTGLLNLTLAGGLTPYAGTSTVATLGVTISNGGAVLGSAGTCPSYTAVAVSLTANVGQQVALTPAQPVAGTVYGDANHDGALGGGETGIGQTTYVKLASGSPGACTSPASQVATVNASTGAYAFAAVNAGSYCLIASTNATLSDVTASAPSGFLRTETPVGIRALTVATSAVTAQNFGLYAGSSLAGRVFTDNGAGGGTANDGSANGTETAIAGVTVAVKSGGSTLATTTTDATGAYLFYLPSSTSGAIGVVETPPSGSIAVSGAVGTSGGTYARATNTTTFTYAAGSAWTGVHFGNVAANTFGAGGAQTVGPGAVVPYAHSFVAGSAGQLTFTTAAVSTPSAAWTQSVILDANCNGVVDAGETAVSGAIAVTAGQTVCIVVRDTSPAATANGAQDVVTVSATLAYANAVPAYSVTSTATDTTTVSTAILLQLAEQVRNVTKATAFATANSAAPNDTLEYQLVVTNPAATAVTAVVVNATVPTYTAFVSTSCPSPLPAGITACAVTAQPASGAQGAVQWTFTGALGAAGTVAVKYQVVVAQ